MPRQHQIKKIIDSFKGLDRRTSDLIDNPEYAFEMVNTDYRDNRTIVKRKGMHYLTQGAGGYGLFTYKKANIYHPDNNPTGDGSISDELLCADNNLHRMIKETVSINHANNPSNPQNIYVTLAVDAETNTFKFSTSDGGSIDIGTGLEPTPVTISQLATDIAALVDQDGINLGLTLSISTGLTGNEPAAFIEPFESVKIADNSSLDVDYHTWEQVSVGDSSFNSGAPFTQYYNSKGEDSLENISNAFLNNNMYFATGYDELMKYDGAKIYRAGLPKPATPSVTATPSLQGITDNGTVFGLEHNQHLYQKYYYKVVYRFTDANGNTITSQPSEHTSINIQNHRHAVELSIPTIQPGTGFDINNIKILVYRTKGTIDDSTVAGANFYLVTQSDVTIDKNPVSGNPAVVTDLDATTDHVNETKIEIPNTDPIEYSSITYDNNIISNDPSVTEVKFLDVFGDEDLVDTVFLEEYVEGRHDLPPKGRYLEVHQGCLVIAGRHDFGNEFNYSLPSLNLVTGEIGTEYFPSDDRSLIVESPAGGKITAVKSLKDTLYIFHTNAITYLNGDISVTGAPLPRTDVLTKQSLIGSTNHDSIQEYRSTLSFLFDTGIYNINASAGFPDELSKNISPLIRDEKLIKKRAVSFYDRDSQLFMFYIPREDIHNNTIHANDESLIFCLDTLNGAWFNWKGLNMSGGIAEYEGQTYFMTREYDDNTFSVVNRLCKMKKRDDYTDYTDHNKAINFTFITSWESLQEPNLFKKFIRCKTFIRDSAKAIESKEFTLNLYLRKDFTDYDIGPIELKSGQLGGWGRTSWGESLWGDRGFEGIVSKLFGKAKSIAFHYENSKVNENVLISGISYEIAATYNPEIKE
jgi:hypothetical protein